MTENDMVCVAAHVKTLRRAYRLLCRTIPPDGRDELLVQALQEVIGDLSAMMAGEWPMPITPAPDMPSLVQWLWEDSGCEVTDGCWCEPDGKCPHGHPSWLVRLGLI